MNKKKEYIYKLEIFFSILGGLVGLFLLNLMLDGDYTNTEEVMLNKGTTTIFEKFNGNLIHCRDNRDAYECISGYKTRNNGNVVLLLGNSQLHAINQFTDGEEATSLRLFKKLTPLNLDLITFSYGNANLQEHSVLFEYLLNQLPIKTLVLPIVFDDMREDGVRLDVMNINNNSMPDTKEINVDNSIIQFNQEYIEKKILDYLESNYEFWYLRSEGRYHVYKNMRFIRNYLFNIKPSTIRKKIPVAYKKNFDSLTLILELAKKKNIKVLIYIAPIRNDIELPYNLEEYNEFKKEIELITKKYEFIFRNYENIVPSEFWGLKDSTNLEEKLEIDYMHFTYKGHEILADKIYYDMLKYK